MNDILDFRIDGILNTETSEYTVVVSVWDGDKPHGSKVYVTQEPLMAITLSKAFILARSALVFDQPGLTPEKHDENGNKQMPLPF